MQAKVKQLQASSKSKTPENKGEIKPLLSIYVITKLEQ